MATDDIFINDDRWIQAIDEHGRLVEMPYRRYLRIKKRRAEQADQYLGLQRDKTPMEFFELPEHPDSPKWMRFATAIEKIPHDVALKFNTQDANVWMRCVQLYWNAKAIALAHRVYPLGIPDPLAEKGFIQRHLLPSSALENLKLDVNADESWLRLLVAGESFVQQWGQEHGYQYPFESVEELFIETLKISFGIYFVDGILCPVPFNWPRKVHRDHYRQWLKFLNDHYNGTSQEADYERVLLTMEWKGYALLALRPLKGQQPFTRLWQQYLKHHRPLLNFQDTAIHWEDEDPYQSGLSSIGRRTRSQQRIESQLTQDGHFTWQKHIESE